MDNRSAPAIAPWLALFGAVPVRVQSFVSSTIPDLQTAETIGRMSRHVRDAWQHPLIAAAVHDADADVVGLTPSDRASRIFWWIKTHVRFKADPLEDEFLIEPSALLSMPVPAGDCDDFSMLAAAMCARAGVRTEFVTIAADAGDPSKYSHVYVQARTELGPVALDTSHGDYPGWSAEQIGPVWRRQRWPVFIGGSARQSLLPDRAGRGRLTSPLSTPPSRVYL